MLNAVQPDVVTGGEVRGWNVSPATTYTCRTAHVKQDVWGNLRPKVPRWCLLISRIGHDHVLFLILSSNARKPSERPTPIRSAGLLTCRCSTSRYDTHDIPSLLPRHRQGDRRNVDGERGPERAQPIMEQPPAGERRRDRAGSQSQSRVGVAEPCSQRLQRRAQPRGRRLAPYEQHAAGEQKQKQQRHQTTIACNATPHVFLSVGLLSVLWFLVCCVQCAVHLRGLSWFMYLQRVLRFSHVSTPYENHRCL